MLGNLLRIDSELCLALPLLRQDTSCMHTTLDHEAHLLQRRKILILLKESLLLHVSCCIDNESRPPNRTHQLVSERFLISVIYAGPN